MAQKADKTDAGGLASGGSGAALYSIGDLSGEFGISTRAIRFYEAKGLLSPKRVGSNRIYTRRDRARLILILRGKRLGFSLEEIAEYLDLYAVDQDHLTQIRLLLGRVERSIAELEGKERDIKESLAELRDIREQCVRQLKGQNSK
jgi:DNA-binding transcriptional MerR regulator